MSTITQRKKLSKGTWALILIFFIAIIAVAVAAALGFVDLTFITEWLVGVMTFGAVSYVNSIIVLSLPFIGGLLTCYITYRYFIGQKVTTTMPLTGGYNPQPTTPSQPQSGSETVIS